MSSPNSVYLPQGRRAKRGVAAVLLSAAVISPAGAVAIAAPATAQDCSTVPWMDLSKSADVRAEALLDASSQHQKYRWLVEQPANSPAQTAWADGVVYPAQVECTPTVIYNNGPDGVYNSAGTTAWPGPIAVASTWDLELGQLKAEAHGREAFDKRSAVVLGPGITSGRTPLSGRTSEYFGEDPLLSGLMAAANVRGLEDRADGKPVIANLKHYVANEQEVDRQTSSSNMDERTLRQVYDLPYEIAVKESNPGSIMCSYNQINGTYTCEDEILTDNLRDKMGFEGYVMSDFGSVHSTAASLNAGLDQELNRPIWFTPAKLDAALAAGEITQDRIDEAAFRVVRSYIEGGLFDNPVPSTPVANVSTSAHKDLARQIAEESTVLLKNNGALPLIKEKQTVAVIGPTAATAPTAGVSAKTGCAWYLVFTRGTALNCNAIADPLTSITTEVQEAGGFVVYDNGADPAKAAAVAAEADVAIVFGHYTMGETTDLADLNLDANGDTLISAVAAASDRTVAVINAGSAVEMPWLEDVDAVLHAWHSGEQFGPALTNLLWGEVNPSAKLPMTFPKSVSDTPTGSDSARYPGVFADGSTVRPAGSTEIRQVEYTEGLQVGYKWYDEQGIDPLFEFGHGLSYTDFAYSDLTVKPDSDPETGTFRSIVSFTVQNTGPVAGTEIPQVYLTLPESSDEPGKRLVGFDRIELGAGESKRVEVIVDSTSSNQPFSVWDTEADAWSVVDGEYGLAVGSSSRDLPLTEALLVDRVAPTITSVSLSKNQKIVVQATDELSGVARIEYSTQKNGQQASPWTSYTGPLQVDAKSTVSFRAIDNVGNVSAVTEVNRKDLR
jgi:beta-glucosidase